MPIVWNDKELKAMADDLPDTGLIKLNRNISGTEMWGNLITTSLKGIIRAWNDPYKFRAATRNQFPDLYGAMMVPLKETPRYMGDPNAAAVIEWRMRHRR